MRAYIYSYRKRTLRDAVMQPVAKLHLIAPALLRVLLKASHCAMVICFFKLSHAIRHPNGYLMMITK